MFFPKNSKFKKWHKGKNKNKIVKNSTFYRLKFGSVGLKSVTYGNLSSKQIETFSQTIKKVIKKFGKLTIRVSANVPVTKKPIETRMGKGKGNVDLWISKIKPGKVIFEIETFSFEIAYKALNIIKKKVPFKTQIIQI
jgi:large subunit ribosomal protein L16